MVSVNVLFFGPAKDFAKAESAVIELADGATIADLRLALRERYPSLAAALPTIRFAVNEEFADDDTTLTAGDDIAVIPPVSGGADDDRLWVDLTTDRIPLDRVRALVGGDPTLGGIVTFEGTTRREVDEAHGALTRLEYEAFEPMAKKQLRRIAREALRRWSLGRLALVHRLGSVPPAEVSVVIAVAAGHRAESFQACRWLIDAIKRDVPIWKKDVFEDGHVRWVRPTSALNEIPGTDGPIHRDA